ncbi:hypothetical protein [Halorubrum coriense]|uniref:hypothetical protein n=1 Tax=Halorubrum coriense TaxID=64713 RepID=UPI0012689916|nr:hypothetical protein [Halorubrum coriense]
MSSQSGTHPAHALRSLRLRHLWTKLILALAPIDGLKEARQQVVSLFLEAYLEIDEFQDAFDQSNSDLRGWAVEPYDHITDYDPHEAVTALLQFPEKVLSKTRNFLIVAFATGSVLSINWLWALAVDGIQLIGVIRGHIPRTVMAVVIVYLCLLRADKLIHQTLSGELRVGRARVQTRRRAQIVGYGVWNRSLIGRSGLFLVGLFYILGALPELPVVGRLFEDPVSCVMGIISGNMDILHHSEGVLDAIYRLGRRHY